MQQHRQPGVEVVVQDRSAPSGAAHRLPRPLPVEEALQYSPMTSAPLFGLGKLTLHGTHFTLLEAHYTPIDSILRPDIARPSLSSWSGIYDYQAAGRIIDTLDNETQASTSNGESRRLETARGDLQKLLIDDHLTEL